MPYEGDVGNSKSSREVIFLSLISAQAAAMICFCLPQLSMVPRTHLSSRLQVVPKILLQDRGWRGY